MRKLLVWVAILTVVAVVAGPATAGGKGGSSIQLVRNSSLRTASGDPALAEQVTFAVSTTRTDWPWVQARCWRDGQVVYEEWHGFYSGYPGDQTFTLGPTVHWKAGPADCQGRLVRFANGGQDQTLATTSFHVSG